MFRLLATVAVIILGLSHEGCASREVTEKLDNNTTLPTVEEAVTPLPSPSPTPSLFFSEGWNGITMIARYAKIDVDTTGHFTTTRNACFKEESGAVSVEVWNSLAQTLNAVVKEEFLKEPTTCITVTENIDNKMDGYLEIILPNNKKQSVFDVKWNEICSTIKDKALSEKLLQTINSVITITENEDCQPVSPRYNLGSHTSLHMDGTTTAMY